MTCKKNSSSADEVIETVGGGGIASSENKPKSQFEQQVLAMAVNICAHGELDLEIDLGGNGTNPSEASNVAYELFEMLGVAEETYRPLISQRVAEIEVEGE